MIRNLKCPVGEYDIPMALFGKNILEWCDINYWGSKLIVLCISSFHWDEYVVI